MVKCVRVGAGFAATAVSIVAVTSTTCVVTTTSTVHIASLHFSTALNVLVTGVIQNANLRKIGGSDEDAGICKAKLNVPGATLISTQKHKINDFKCDFEAVYPWTYNDNPWNSK